MRWCSIALSVALLACPILLLGAGAVKSGSKPILVELFTSEGCSSCPPADAWLEKIDRTQPLTGSEIIVLSEHVDYWDHDGWKDPYSSHSLTERQSDYVGALRLNTAYTPQIIVDGTGELHLEKMQEGSKLFEKATEQAKVPISVGTPVVTPGSIQAHLEVNGGTLQHDGQIYLAIALDHAESQVLRGENGGRHLTHVAVVREIEKVGKISKGSTFSRDVQLKVKPAIDPSNLRIVVFIQESGPGQVLGAAMWKP